MLAHSLHYFAPTCAIVDTILDTEDPSIDSYCNFFAQIFWNLLGLYDLMPEGRETAENIHMYMLYLSPTFGGYLIMNTLVVLFKYLYALKVLRQIIVEHSELELFTK